ncbi:AAA family ATPase [Aliivibrio sp. S4TY2]|uniref:AAA family ATPase n=1 Tax=unclassified Aliivibrio TaxID=2645654 RepID=UPI0023786967|nr:MULTISPECIES: AAA family ATPase [unclassified Aliivibrio]MDD9156864.1 AAA family ATPase [Aliivibrio sp. S4TY2]MDD9160922.1 AAA family ATPase [Aliivibrio sp. S4TY1]MDD9164952.1 AAA family ATPase [Aliivibrio sp. S4MY2]MDD9168773.1 AAA family ATPase [Aliivibrio sp. S4MY4]MDD9185302.1 AAA family ATPase [Aliivibrio sp. S4MY3]
MLNKIDAVGFKSLSKESLPLKPLTIITGVNSSGKSTLIQSILLAIRHSSIENKYKMEPLTNYLDRFSEIRNKNNNSREINISIDSDYGKYNLTITADNIIKSGDGLYGLDLPENNTDPELFYLNANRQGPDDTSTISESKVGTSAQHVFSYFEKVKDKVLSDSLCRFNESPTLAYQVGRWLSFITDTKTELKTESQSSSKVSVFFEDDKLGQVSPFNLGAGMSYVAKIIILCLIAKKDDLIIIENPEIHLHPKAQAQLGVFFSFIAKNGIQLLLETHCEHLLNKIRHQVFRKELNKKDVVVLYKSEVYSPFEKLYLNGNGHYVDENNTLTIFPKGFFDGTLNELIEIGG